MRVIQITIASSQSLPADLKDIKIVKVAQQIGTEHAEANHTEIKLFPLFFKEDKKLQLWILGHELGHWYFNNSIFQVKKQILTYERGTGFWQDSMTSEEGFANMFSDYILSNPELILKYPEQYKILDILLKKHKQALLNFMSSILKDTL